MARVLMVLDGEYRFTGADATGTADFTYITLVNALESAGHVVTKAHRQSDTSGGVLQSFNFDTSVNLLDFDVLWLLGHNGRNTQAIHSSKRMMMLADMRNANGVIA